MTETKGELTVVKEISIDKDDITAIAVAEAEKKMRLIIKDFKNQIKVKELAIEQNVEYIELLGKKFLENKIKARVNVIAGGLKATKIKGLTLETTFQPAIAMANTASPQQTASNLELNTAKLVISYKPGESKATSLYIDILKYKPTPQQTAAMKYNIVLKNDIDNFVTQNLKWRQRLNDIATLERQIRAQMAKDQLNKTREGKKLVKALSENFEENIKLLGI